MGFGAISHEGHLRQTHDLVNHLRDGAFSA